LTTVKVFTAVDPIFTFPNTRLLTEVVRSTMPVPVSAELCGLVVALSLSVSDALSALAAAGVNATASVHDVLGATVTGIAPQVPVSLRANSAGSDEAALEMTRELVAPVFLTVRVLVVVWPTATLPNASDAVSDIVVVGVAVAVGVAVEVMVAVDVAV